MAFLDEKGLTYLWKKIKLAPYPVGSIYTSENSTSPASLFGGTWEQIKGKFLLAEDGNTYKAGTEGGEAQHKLTQGEIPNYTIGDIPEAVPDNHQNWNNGGVTSRFLGNTSDSKPGISNNNEILTIKSGAQFGYTISTAGGSQPHTNMPPYVAVYVWKRVS